MIETNASRDVRRNGILLRRRGLNPEYNRGWANRKPCGKNFKNSAALPWSRHGPVRNCGVTNPARKPAV